MKELYEKILQKWFYNNNEKVVRLNDIKEIFEDAEDESNRLEQLVMRKNADGTTEYLLQKLLSLFYVDGQALIWSYIEGTSVGEVLGGTIENQLKEIKSNFPA